MNRITCVNHLHRSCPMIAALPDLDTEKCPGCGLHIFTRMLSLDKNLRPTSPSLFQLPSHVDILVRSGRRLHLVPLYTQPYVTSQATQDIKASGSMSRNPRGEERRVAKDSRSSTHSSVTCTVCPQGPGPAFLLQYLYHPARENWEIHTPVLRKHCPASSFTNTNDNFFIGLSSIMIIWQLINPSQLSPLPSCLYYSGTWTWNNE